MKLSSLLTPSTVLFCLFAIVFQGCAQNLKQIVIPDPSAETAPLKCGVRASTVVDREKALCIAKVSGLESGVNKWQFREFDDYVDVFNTVTINPVERGVGVRLRKVGGAVLSIGEWRAVTVQSGVHSETRPTYTVAIGHDICA